MLFSGNLNSFFSFFLRIWYPPRLKTQSERFRFGGFSAVEMIKTKPRLFLLRSLGLISILKQVCRFTENAAARSHTAWAATLSSSLCLLHRSTYSRTTSTTSQTSRAYPSDSRLQGRRRSSSTGSQTGSTKVRPRLLLPHHSEGGMCEKVFFFQTAGMLKKGKKKKSENHSLAGCVARVLNKHAAKSI